MTDFAKEARDLRSEIDRLTGLLAHIREHILTDEDFDADELASDIAGSVNLSEYNRLMRRAESASRQLAEARAAIFAEVSAEARRYAEHYPQSSDGRNTFILFAEWAEARALLSGEPR